DLLQLAVELRLVRAELLEIARLDQLVHRGRARLHLLGLVLGALNREARALHLAADAGRGLADTNLGLRGRVLRLDHFLLGAELLAPRLELLLVVDEPDLLVLELLDLSVEVLELLLDPRLALQRLAGEILAPSR